MIKKIIFPCLFVLIFVALVIKAANAAQEEDVKQRFGITSVSYSPKTVLMNSKDDRDNNLTIDCKANADAVWTVIVSDTHFELVDIITAEGANVVLHWKNDKIYSGNYLVKIVARNGSGDEDTAYNLRGIAVQNEPDSFGSLLNVSNNSITSTLEYPSVTFLLDQYFYLAYVDVIDSYNNQVARLAHFDQTPFGPDNIYKKKQFTEVWDFLSWPMPFNGTYRFIVSQQKDESGPLTYEVSSPVTLNIPGNDPGDKAFCIVSPFVEGFSLSEKPLIVWSYPLKNKPKKYQIFINKNVGYMEGPYLTSEESWSILYDNIKPSENKQTIDKTLKNGIYAVKVRAVFPDGSWMDTTGENSKENNKPIEVHYFHIGYKISDEPGY